MTDKDDLPVSSTDELSISGEAAADRPRKLGEFKATNSPLSASDIEHRQDRPDKKKQHPEWVSRSSENIDELVPIPEDEPTKE
jgi:hypothetical protein